MTFNRLTSSLTLTGSACSCFGSGGIIICSILYHRTQRSFRHLLVFNLAVADFINSLNNTISGSIYIVTKELHAGPACTFNGWVGQLSVQATDFSILAISIATLYVVTRRVRLDGVSAVKRVLLCLSLWVWPLVSSTTVTALGEMKPVSGNWCWISRTRPDLRYGLAHGWRFAIIGIVFCIYVYVYQYLSRHFRALVMPTAFTRQPENEHRGWERSWPENHPYQNDENQDGIPLNGRSFLNISPDGQQEPAPSLEQPREDHPSGHAPGGTADIASAYYHTPWESDAAAHLARKPTTGGPLTSITAGGPSGGDPFFSTASQHESLINSGPFIRITTEQSSSSVPITSITSKKSSRASTRPFKSSASKQSSRVSTGPFMSIGTKQSSTTTSSNTTRRRMGKPNSSETVEAEIKRMLLLNGYPIMYVLLWIPGLTNRALEASGKPTSSAVLSAMQCSTQFVGFANALTYGLSREMRQTLWRDLRRLFGKEAGTRL